MPDRPCREWIMEPPTPGVQCELAEEHDGDHRALPDGMLLPVVWNDDERLRFADA